ncbi:hypothetical protein A167_00405 [Alcanivorax sp. S71-1-4]|uniref:hypothetical protein n=1 Tax=Alcanivorax sp. S71-1-4 TaxID=1177159 RepID=UPI00135AB2C8|nr:hypothetical protein [Alcanivorax sp. S71-1-4]KAF0810918.1 hypothetical protein A167_00405 [Alcanivorax sp. S71-1-4]
MLNRKDFYTFHAAQPLIHKNAATGIATTIGTTITRYEIRRYRDVRNLADTLAYQVLCTQRIVIPNATAYTPGGANVTLFANYPAVVTNHITLAGAQAQELVDYSPRTVNSSVVTSVSSSAEHGASTTMQHTSGSSTSQSNSFGASAQIGFFGDVLTGGVSVDASHSWGSDHSKSVSAGNEAGSSRQQDSNDSMTVKDWACYTTLDPVDSSPTWVWGQEYPWNVIQFRNTNNTDNILLPAYVNALLTDGTQLFPPSQLSQFGIDFTMKAAWVLKGADSLTVTHAIDYFTATHQLNGATVNASLNGPQTFTVTHTALDLCTYGLDPLQYGGATQVAIVGFIPRQFHVQPVPAAVNNAQITSPTPFKIIAPANNLLIEDATDYSGLTTADAGAGFTASDTALTATFTPHCTSMTMALRFKVMDTEHGYRLYVKHWKTESAGVVLTIVINGDTDHAIVKYVDAFEAEGGENNLLSLSLRNLDYGSVDFHDYLQLGLNSIDITLAPIGDNPANCGYQVRAISIERE